nr:ABC transporter ATP-binding protein [Butyrivibrio sp.]
MEISITNVSSYIPIIISSILSCKLFQKCGITWWYSLIPFYRSYCLGKCAKREDEGRIYAVLSACVYITWLLASLFPETSNIQALLACVTVALSITAIVYAIRIYSGLCIVFNRKKRWIWLWVFEWTQLIPVLIWGFNDKYQPKEGIYDKEDIAKESGAHADTVNSGLTINIESRTVYQSFKKYDLLKDIHLTIPRGHLVLLLGGSGAGKTTFLNAVTGYEKANACIELNGQNVYKEYDKMKYDIGFVPQQDLMRVTDTVELTLEDSASMRLSTKTKSKAREIKVDELLEAFGLEPVKGNLVQKLSGGQKKRLSIAMEIISNPSLFILDEPDSGLDGVVARKLFEQLRKIADQNKIVIVITHTPDRVIDLFDDVIVLAKDANRTGRLAYYGPIKESYEFFGKNSMEEILLS